MLDSDKTMTKKVKMVWKKKEGSEDRLTAQTQTRQKTKQNTHIKVKRSLHENAGKR